MTKGRKCGKVRYSTRADAEAALARRRPSSIGVAGVYRCRLADCKGRYWHVTSAMSSKVQRRRR